MVHFGGRHQIHDRRREDTEDVNEEENSNGYSTYFEELELRAPRSYNFVLKVVIPVILIIPICIMCGYVLARIEAPQEMIANHEAMKTFVQKNGYLDAITFFSDENLDICTNEFRNIAGSVTNDGMVNLDEYNAHISACKKNLKEINAPFIKSIRDHFANSRENSLSFNWNRCHESRKATTEEEQKNQFYTLFVADFHRLNGQYNQTSQNFTQLEKAARKANAEAKADDHCEVNVGGGSIFWWTVMTTVGFGNASLSTSEGRLMVIVVGFISMILFTAVLGHAGYVTIQIFDDFCLRNKLECLTRGWCSILLALAALFAWYCMVAVFISMYWNNKYGFSLTYTNCFWFSFITGTTIGFGDISLNHDMFVTRDMLGLPVAFLISFVMLSIFLNRLVIVISPYFEEGAELGSILENSRRRSSIVESN